MIYLHLGCADRYFEGLINIDKMIEWKGKKYRLDDAMDIAQPWHYQDESVDGIVTMNTLQQLYWRDLVFALKEAYRVLRKGGIIRIGVPTIENGKPIDYLLGWGNINLLSLELMKIVLEQIGFKNFRRCVFGDSAVPEFVQVDNRPEQTIFMEVTK